MASLRTIIPGVGGKVARLNQFARDLVTERKKRGSMTKDLFHHLVSYSFISYIVAQSHCSAEPHLPFLILFSFTPDR